MRDGVDLFVYEPIAVEEIGVGRFTITPTSTRPGATVTARSIDRCEFGSTNLFYDMVSVGTLDPTPEPVAAQTGTNLLPDGSWSATLTIDPDAVPGQYRVSAGCIAGRSGLATGYGIVMLTVIPHG